MTANELLSEMTNYRRYFFFEFGYFPTRIKLTREQYNLLAKENGTPAYDSSDAFGTQRPTIFGMEIEVAE